MSTGKKVRRVRRPQSSSPRSGNNESTLQPITLTTPAPVAAAPKKNPNSTEAELREEYAYVLKDLRRVFLLAAAMFILLILVNLFLL
jgi:hypothetical protein